MKRTLAVTVALSGATLGLTAGTVGTALASTAPTVLTAELSGEAEVPPGDPDGRGSARVTIEQDQLCFALMDVQGVAPVTAGHIHPGGPGVVGPVVIPLLDEPEGLPTEQPFNSEQRCVDAEAAMLGEVRSNPGQFYVNLHNAEFPGGAIRGQLAAGQSGQAGQPGELPFTGTSAADVALLGLGLTAIGAAVVVAGRRRPASR
jgi:hypothetical protein